MKKLLSAIVALTLLLTCALPGALAEVDKKEMVYVLADADGSVNDVIVSERLYNRDGEAQLTDVSRLTDIENVGGDQTWTEENGNLVWNADGADIRYEGSSTEPLPVTVSLRYTLDGQEMTAEELKGKSGHLVIDVTYRAEQMEEVAVGDQLATMPMPFFAATVLLADESVFQNVTVDNGRVLDIGDRSLVVAMGLPGVEECLNLAAYEELEDVNIPTAARIEADVTDFALDGTYTLATNSIFSDVDVDEEGLDIDLDQIQDDLTDAMNQLLDGASQLRDGAQELKDGVDELSDGLTEIDSNSAKLVDAAQQLLQTVLDTANESLSGKAADLAKLNIEVRTLTIDNYADEVARLQREYLANVEDYVLEQADAQLSDKVNAAVREEVVRQVNEAARQQVEEKVRQAVEAEVRSQVEAGAAELVRSKVNEAVEQKVRAAVEAEVRAQVESGVNAAVRQQVEAAVRNPDEATLNAQIEQQMQTEAVQKEIEANVETMMKSDEVQKLIDAQLEQAVRAKVEAAFEQNVRAQVEQAVRAEEEKAVAAAVEQQIRKQVEEELKPQTPAEPTPIPEPTAAPAPSASAGAEETSEPSTLARMMGWLLPSANAEEPSFEDKVNAIVAEKMASDEVKAQIQAQTDAQMQSADVQARIDARGSEKADGRPRRARSGRGRREAPGSGKGRGRRA